MAYSEQSDNSLVGGENRGNEAKPFRLLNLPLELREIIYTRAFTDRFHFRARKDRLKPRSRARNRNVLFHDNVKSLPHSQGLLLAFKEIHSEAIAIYYGTIEFVFSDPRVADTVYYILDIEPEYLAKVTSIRVVQNFQSWLVGPYIMVGRMIDAIVWRLSRALHQRGIVLREGVLQAGS